MYHSFAICHSERSEESQVLAIEKRYQELKTANSKTALQILASFDPKNSLQMDIAREYLSNPLAISSNDKRGEGKIDRVKEIEILKEILKKTHIYPVLELIDLLKLQNNWVIIDDTKEYLLITCKLRGEGISPREIIKGELIKTKKQQVIKTDQLIVAEIDAKNGGFGIVPKEADGAIVSSHYYVYNIDQKLLPKFLSIILRSPKVLEQVSVFVRGTTNYAAIRADDFPKIKIPIPSLEVQNEIVEKTEKQKQIIEGAERIEESFAIQIDNLPTEGTSEVGKLCELVYGEPLPEKDRRDGQFPVFGAGNVIGCHENFLVKGPAIVIGRRGATSGTVMWSDNSCWPIDTAFYVKIKDPRIEMKYLYYALKSLNFFKYQFGGAMPGINRNDIYSETISLPSLETQRQIVEKLDRQMQALEGVRLLKEDAQKRIEEILAVVWGE